MSLSTLTPSPRLAAITAFAAVLTAAAPGMARADSIAYIKAGDVWLSTADGARQYRVTDTGGYADVTQADDGTMVALHGVRLHRLDRTGTVLADFDTPVSDTRPEGDRVFYGPFDPAISPNGQRLAYTYYYVGKGSRPGCTPPTCMTTVTEGGTGYSWADRQTDWDEPGLGRHSGWRNATWVDDATTMISDPTHLPNADVLLDVVGDRGVPIMDWFSDNGTQHLGGGEMTRARDKLAFQADQGDASMRIYRMNGAYPALPTACYAYGDAAGGSVGHPTWSPDGARLAWDDADGVKVVSVPSFAGGCTTDGASPTARLLVAGASDPDWGPADVPAGAGRVPGGGGGGATPSSSGGGATPSSGGGSGANPGSGAPSAGNARPGLAVRVSAARLASGVKIKITLPEAGTVEASATTRGRRIGTATTQRASKGGPRTLTVRLTSKGRQALRRAKGKAQVKVTFTPLVGAKLTATVTVHVRGAH